MKNLARVQRKKWMNTILPSTSDTGHRIIDLMARVAYCFTWNNYTEDRLVAFKEWLEENCKYACLQKETAPTTGTQHIQGYLNLAQKKTMGYIQKKLTDIDVRLSLLGAKGTATQNRAYCSKPGGTDFYEIGNIKIAGQGARSDLSEVAEKVLGKRPISEIANEHPETFIKYHKGINSLSFALDLPLEERPMETILYFGDARTGKSTKARMIARLYGSYYKLGMPNNGSLFFDGYKGELSLIIDEFKGWISPTYLNDLLDKYRMILNLKGSSTYAKYEHVFITSNFPPEEWWSDKVIWNKEALFGRLTSIYEFRGTSHVDSIIKKLK